MLTKVAPNGALSIIAGTGSYGTPVTGGAATSSPFEEVEGLVVDASGDVFISDESAGCVTMVSATTGNLAALSRGNVVPGPATSTQLKVSAVTVTGAWNLYFGEYDAYRLYRLDATPGPSEAPLELTATAGNARATVSFLPPDDDGNTSLTSYQVSVDGGAWVTLTTTAGSGGRLGGVVTGLTNGQSYGFRVRAVTSISGAAASNTAQATPAAPSSGGGSWFRDVVPPAQRAQEVAVPKSPRAYRGPRAFTRARNKAYAGQTAMPVPSIKGRAMAAGQAAVLSGDGLFEFNSSVLTKEGRRQVRLLVPALRDAGRVVCEGYTDYGADLAWEYRLSRARAKRVCSALTAGGVDAVMVPKGFGPQRPVVISGPRAKRSPNRCVVVLARA